MRLIVTIVLSLIFCGCNSKIEPKVYLSQDEYDVFTTIINDKYQYRLDSTNELMNYDTVFILSKTSSVDILNKGVILNCYSKQPNIYPLDTLKPFSTSGEWDTLVSNYNIVSKDTFIIESSKLVFPFRYSILTLSNKFIKKQAFIGFSRVGFNVSRNEAIVYFYFGEYEGGGEFTVLLKKENDKWKIIKGYGVNHGMMSGYAYYKLVVP